MSPFANLEIADSLRNHELTFSSIGYQDHSYAISQLLKEKTIEVTLQEKITAFAEVRVSNVKRKMYV